MVSAQFGLVHLYVGDGKGKTTAAMGLAIRAMGADRKVFVAQFLKGQWTCEVPILQRLEIDVVRTADITKFTNQMNDDEKNAAKNSCRECFLSAKEALTCGNYGLVVLDEVVDAVNEGFVDVNELIEIITSRSEGTEVVMTGRNPKQEIVDAADYLTVMSALKHPYQRGIVGRKGIEY